MLRCSGVEQDRSASKVGGEGLIRGRILSVQILFQMENCKQEIIWVRNDAR